jgi:trigger factor
MIKRKSKDKVYFYCSNYYRNKTCEKNKSMSENRLIEIIKEKLNLTDNTRLELENKVKEELQKEEQAKLDDIHLDKVLDKAMENMKIELNEEIVDDEIHRMIHEYERQLKMQGLDMNKYFELTGDTEEGLHKKMEGEATKRVKCRYLIEEVAKKENIDFTKEEVDAKAKEMAENYGITVDELIKAYGTIDVVKYDMTMHKALEIIKENN